MTDRAENVRRLHYLIDTRPKNCPNCGAILGPIMPLLDAGQNVIGVAFECSNDNDCEFGSNEKVSLGHLAVIWSDPKAVK